jgi:putative phosphoesterase
MRLGLLSDTHGYLGDDVFESLAGVDAVIHAGDVGEAVLGPLGALAPLTAVRGNTDTRGEAAGLPEHVELTVAGLRITVVHRYLDRPASGYDVLVFGHCHRTHAETEGGILFLNPGAAGRRGFHTRRSVAILEITDGRPECHFIDLGPRSQR